MSLKSARRFQRQILIFSPLGWRRVLRTTTATEVVLEDNVTELVVPNLHLLARELNESGVVSSRRGKRLVFSSRKDAAEKTESVPPPPVDSPPSDATAPPGPPSDQDADLPPLVDRYTHEEVVPGGVEYR